MDKDTPRGRQRSEARSAEILWAAAQLFAARGIAAATTRDIAAAAHTTERTLFKHFGSKEGLVRAVLEEAVLSHLAPTSLAGLQEAIAACEGDLQQWHRALLQARLRDLSAAPELTRLLLAELLRDAQIREAFAAQWEPAAWRPLVQLFETLQAGGAMRRDIPAPRLVRQFLSLNLGFLLGRLILAPELPWEDAEEIGAIAAAFHAAARPPR
jgi:AcrR family transcriptional regulator